MPSRKAFTQHSGYFRLLRLSNTEPVLRLYLELDNKDLLIKEENRIKEFVSRMG